MIIEKYFAVKQCWAVSGQPLMWLAEAVKSERHSAAHCFQRLPAIPEVFEMPLAVEAVNQLYPLQFLF